MNSLKSRSQRQVWHLITACCALFSLSPSMHAAEKSMSVAPGTFNEKYDPSVNVSGQIRAGLMFGGENKAVDLAQLKIHFPFVGIDKGAQVCVRLASRNGVYSAKWLATANQNILVGGVAKVEINTDKDNELADYKTNTLVGIATLGNNCKDKNPIFLPLSWGKDGLTSLKVYLNADATETSLHVKFNDKSKPVSDDCEDLSRAEKTLAFDTTCSVDLKPKAEPKILVVKRSSFSTPMKKIRFDLAKPPK